jgi:hypothetical protein
MLARMTRSLGPMVPALLLLQACDKAIGPGHPTVHDLVAQLKQVQVEGASMADRIGA